MKEGLIQVYTGNGKGKTTAAMGLVIRAVGHGLKVKVIQFMKSEFSGEIAPLKQLGVEIILGNHQHKPTWKMNEEEEQVLIQDTKIAWETFVEAYKSNQYDLIILDEVNHALNRGYITKEEMLKTVKEKSSTELVFTGRNAPSWLMENAHLVTEMKMIKHPFNQGYKSRIGIEK